MKDSSSTIKAAITGFVGLFLGKNIFIFRIRIVSTLYPYLSTKADIPAL